MLTSSILNSVTFKNLDGGYPNRENTLHINRKQGSYTILPYWQKFNKDDVIPLQFTSDSATVPELKSFIPSLNETIAGTLVSSYLGLDNRYFYNFEITLGATYYDKNVYFTATQDADTLTSEPICVSDISEDLQNGRLVYVKHTNLDRNNSDLSDYWVDWSVIDFMYFYVEAVNLVPGDSDETEILEGSQSNTIISNTYYLGNSLQTGGIPDYLAAKLGNASGLDVFQVNNIQYIKKGGIKQEQYGTSTSVQVEIELTDKNAIGVNVDDLGITGTDTPTMSIIPIRNTGVTTAGVEIDTPEGHMLHSIFITHANTSAASTAVVTIGTIIAGIDLIDSIQGSIAKATYTVALKKWKTFSRHFLKDPDATSKVYIAVSGAGAIMDIILNFDTVTPES